MGLCFTRRAGESVSIGSDCQVIVTACNGGRVKIRIEAPRAVRVLRSEVVDERGCGAPLVLVDALAYLRRLFPAHGFELPRPSGYAVPFDLLERWRTEMDQAGLPWDLVEPFALRACGASSWHAVGMDEFESMMLHVAAALAEVLA